MCVLICLCFFFTSHLSIFIRIILLLHSKLKTTFSTNPSKFQLQASDMHHCFHGLCADCFFLRLRFSFLFSLIKEGIKKRNNLGESEVDEGH